MGPATAPLTCSINRVIRQRIIITRPSIDKIFSILLEISNENLDLCNDEEVATLTRIGRPEITLRLSDGSEYSESETQFLEKVRTGKNRIIDSIDLKVRFGSITCAVSLEAARKFRTPAQINMSGPEDRCNHLIDIIENELIGRRDITTFVYWAGGVTVSLSVLIFALLTLLQIGAFTNLGTGVGIPTAASITITLIPITFLVLLSISDWVLRKYIRPVAFIWGEDNKINSIGVTIARAIAVSIPIWLFANIAGGLLFG